VKTKTDRASIIDWLARHRTELSKGMKAWDNRIKDEGKYLENNVYWYHHDNYAKYTTRRLKKLLVTYMMQGVS
jgi:hypothetical protein